MPTQIINGPLRKVQEQINALPDTGYDLHVVITTEPLSSEHTVDSSRPTLAEMQAKSAETLAYLQELSQNVLTDPEEIRQADEEFEELQRNLNRNRIEAGERPLFPE